MTTTRSLIAKGCARPLVCEHIYIGGCAWMHARGSTVRASTLRVIHFTAAAADAADAGRCVAEGQGPIGFVSLSSARLPCCCCCSVSVYYLAFSSRIRTHTHTHIFPRFFSGGVLARARACKFDRQSRSSRARLAPRKVDAHTFGFFFVVVLTGWVCVCTCACSNSSWARICDEGFSFFRAGSALRLGWAGVRGVC